MRNLVKVGKTGQGVGARVSAVEALSVVAFIAANGDDAVSSEVMKHLEDLRSAGAIKCHHRLCDFNFWCVLWMCYTFPVHSQNITVSI